MTDHDHHNVRFCCLQILHTHLGAGTMRTNVQTAKNNFWSKQITMPQIATSMTGSYNRFQACSVYTDLGPLSEVVTRLARMPPYICTMQPSTMRKIRPGDECSPLKLNHMQLVLAMSMSLSLHQLHMVLQQGALIPRLCGNCCGNGSWWI